jgi:hypothetical protein
MTDDALGINGYSSEENIFIIFITTIRKGSPTGNKGRQNEENYVMVCSEVLTVRKLNHEVYRSYKKVCNI